MASSKSPISSFRMKSTITASYLYSWGSWALQIILREAMEQATHWIRNFRQISPLKAPQPQRPVHTGISESASTCAPSMPTTAFPIYLYIAWLTYWLSLLIFQEQLIASMATKMEGNLQASSPLLYSPSNLKSSEQPLQLLSLSAPTTTSASESPISSHKHIKATSSGNTQKRISSCTAPPASTPPPIFLLAKSIMMAYLQWSSINPREMTTSVKGCVLDFSQALDTDCLTRWKQIYSFSSCEQSLRSITLKQLTKHFSFYSLIDLEESRSRSRSPISQAKFRQSLHDCLGSVHSSILMRIINTCALLSSTRFGLPLTSTPTVQDMLFCLFLSRAQSIIRGTVFYQNSLSFISFKILRLWAPLYRALSNKYFIKLALLQDSLTDFSLL